MRHNALAPLVALGILGGCSGETPSTYQGYVEGEYVHVASPVGGRLERLLVQRGQTIEAKAPLFQLEAEEETAAKRQADEQLKASQAQLADLRVGRRNPELDVAKAQLAQAIAAEQQAAQQLKRDEAQFEVGGIPRAQLDDSRSNHAIKAARVRELQGQLDVSRLPAREDQIRAQDAQVAAARAASNQSSWRLDQKHISAAQGGLVVDTLYREGEWVAPGSPVVRMLPPQNVKLRFFVPQAVAGGLKPGRNIAVRCDGCGDEVPATVSYIASEPEYTPPVIYSNETRAKLVFMVEARPSIENAGRLRPGQPVEVTLK
ncbi:MAG TPA: HlyD family efflux transporter periplasmic adaptor subunit [Burkholderiales bacterium]|jgi:HlyD family secretion protein|nr:HlyD family efflux transporter periplasmic adaptor subunit [Burkholderiales bacterium]